MIVINAVIKDVKRYEASFLPKTLATYTLEDVISGSALDASSFLLTMNNNTYGVSRWKGPKRTRTWPYQHVYDIINRKPRVAIIPYFKDEGQQGNADYLQWDTVSLMSLLGVYVILGYYVKATRNLHDPDKQRITGHAFDTRYIAHCLEELALYHSDPVHWNMNELNKKLPHVMQQTLTGYQAIAKQTGVKLHSEKGLLRRINRIAAYQQDSRALSLLAQGRESITQQKREKTGAGLKAQINITNFYTGAYYLTVDEVHITAGKAFLVEKKHGDGVIPAAADIKDGLLKLMLFTNLDTVTIDGIHYAYHAVLGLTSERIAGYCHSHQPPEKIAEFFAENDTVCNSLIVAQIYSLFHEARINGFRAYLINASEEPVHRAKLFAELGQ